MRPVAVVGNLAIDIVEGAAERVGGGAFHCGRALRLLNTPARLVTKCATADRVQPTSPAAGAVPNSVSAPPGRDFPQA